MTPVRTATGSRVGVVAMGWAAALVGSVVVSMALPRGAAGQIKASEDATMSQTIDGTVVSMTYARPSRRGRDVLFGDAVPWHRWTPGANWATTLEVSRDVTLDGIPLPTGRYSVWIDISEADTWQLVLDPDHRRFHTDPPVDNDTQIRLPVRPRAAPEMETLLWHMDRVRSTGGELRMHWGTTVVAVDLRVQPTQRLTVTPEEAAAVVGSWVVRWVMPGGQESPEATWVVVHDPSSKQLTVDMGPVPEGVQADGAGTYLVPGAPLIFAIAWGVQGEIWEVVSGWAEFDDDGAGIATSFEIRDPETDELWGRGRRSGR